MKPCVVLGLLMVLTCLAHFGHAINGELCHTNCILPPVVVCARNGLGHLKTFKSVCSMRLHNCKLKTDFRELYTGKCKDKDINPSDK